MNLDPKLLSPEDRRALAKFQREHGARVRRATAMALLDIADKETFKKVVDAHPQLKHRLPGERQDKYVTAIIFLLRPIPSRCATGGEA